MTSIHTTAPSAPSGPSDVARGIGRVALGDIIRRAARRFGDKPAILEPQRTLSFRELDESTNRFANYLLSLDLAPRSRIATICTNSADLLIAIYGINKAGMVWVPVNVSLTDDETKYVLTHAEVRAIVIDSQIAARPTMLEALRSVTTQLLAIGDDSTTGFRATIARHDYAEPSVDIHERDLAIVMYTSGTTSLPKGVMHCHLAVYFAVLGNIGEWSVTRGDRLLITLPLFHCAAHIMVTTFLAAGASVALRATFDAGEMIRTVDRDKVTVMIGLPMMYAVMFEHPSRQSTTLSSLRLCIYVMTPMPKTLLPKLIEQFCSNFALTMGQTEMYPMTLMFRPEEQLKRFGSYWGESATINDTAIMDDAGHILGAGETGEVVHRGPNVMLGYFKDPNATASARQFGWHHTGDVGMIDEDGQLLFIDRKKDMIKSGGENVSSVAVEEVLFRHPEITNAAVVGLPHPRWGEAVAAFVTVKAAAAVTEQGIVAHCRAHLAGFQAPKAVKIMSALPMTGSGKVRKTELRESYHDLFTPT